MLRKKPSFICLFTIITIIVVPIQADQQSLPNQFHNLYDDDTNPPNLTNIFRTTNGLLNFLKQSQQDLKQEIPETTPEFGAIYDFVIVGAGTAGTAIAARLSEIPQVKILLIEAGSNENLLMDIPLFASALQLSNDINWKYQTKPSDKYCLGMNNNSCNWPKGKVMGGTSVLNYMIATRGNAEDYDRWAEMGNEGWAYKDVLKYFKKLETIDIPELRSDTTYHGTEGPMHITSPLFHTPLAEAFLKAGEELGYPLVNYNGKDMMIGFSYMQNTIMNGIRMSSNRAYLYPIHDRKNLHVTRESMVRKVLIDRHTKQTIGVEIIKYGRNIPVYASKEVILCAGSIRSPQLLMLSGIGPAEHLSELGIDVVRDAPVGENLMDHVIFGGLTWTIDAPVGIKMQNMINPSYPYMADYYINRSGPLTVPDACEAVGFINTKHPEKCNSLPNMELIFFSSGAKGNTLFPIETGLNDQIRQIWSKYLNKNTWTILPTLLNPKSRGRIRLLANDVNIKPEIVPNYFDNLEDIETLIAGIKVAISVGQTKAMQAYGSRFTNDTIPGCESFNYDSHAYWECAIRTILFTAYHYSGTCKMGPRGDPTAVVDPTLKVIDVQGLRVADASIIPELPAAHLNIPIIMIAEKLADMIKKEWGYLEKPLA
ncbi:glucose dehydrogenase [FAD, quinone]-like [Nylanderia fulva]|uniref:glucose dehydrogenase [FAD, quinone]-like n=1 Tax=Nylanderia fulva TaxID=613905 RepID=UPI0010FAEB57|nr:glucose dehydrogenase [FAD, quinone]-like [Nylanderia fulva]XP_029176890.1 glucose dehydrogenase [FAD, quinone]-like [Nylanderia fulva]XP_029176891.1 glucose dehydrogenase [FAD, quinone]-like [Nylanderia fulva]